MRIFAPPLAVAALVLSGCGGQASLPGGSHAAIPFSFAGHAGAKPAGRLFVSDAGTGDVYVFDVPTLKLFTIVVGLTKPEGECSDDKGHVWVTDPGAGTIDEITYQGRVEGHLSDAGGDPDGCAWDPKTGNLAVLNLIDSGSKPGEVLIYHHASGYPNVYTNPKQYYYDFGGYDAAGDLYFDGSDAQGRFMLSELAIHAGSAKTIAVDGANIYEPGMVQWPSGSSYLVVGDQNCSKAATSCLYQMTVYGKFAAVKNKISLDAYTGGQVCDVVQGVIAYGELFASDDDYCGSGPSTTDGWRYPGGGSPKTLNKKTASAPIGAALSTGEPEPRTHDRKTAPWMDLNAKKLDLLYVGDGNGEVTVYTYWQKTVVGELTGFSAPAGECVDKSNDVYITDSSAQRIFEYAHAGTKSIKKIDDRPYVPYACSVDFTTGDLAVANKSGGTSGHGNIAVFRNGSRKPVIYADSAITSFEGCVYDNQGNLLATNGSAGESSSFAWLPRGGEKLDNITVPGPDKSWTWRSVTGLQWDGRYFAIDYYGLFRIAIRNGLAYYVGETEISENGVYGPYWIYNDNPKKQGTQFVGAYNEEGNAGVEYFNYPAGGDAIGYAWKDLDDPYGVTVSLGKIHE